jgi:hypothetical protein
MSEYLTSTNNSLASKSPAAVLPDDAPANRWVELQNRLSAEEREQLARGLISLLSLHNYRRNPPTDAEIDRLVAEIGAERILAALDRYTQPSPFPAE